MDVILFFVKVLMKKKQIACIVTQATLIQIDNVFLELVLKQTALNAAGMGAKSARKALLSWMAQNVKQVVVLICILIVVHVIEKVVQIVRKDIILRMVPARHALIFMLIVAHALKGIFLNAKLGLLLTKVDIGIGLVFLITVIFLENHNVKFARLILTMTT
jgi:hypothetical protein